MATLEELDEIPEEEFGAATPPQATDRQVAYIQRLLGQFGGDEEEALNMIADHFEEGFSNARSLDELTVGEASWLIDELQ